LESQVLPDNSLIDKMSNHPGCCHTYDFVISFEGSSELNDDSASYQQAYFWNFRIDNCDESSINVSEVWGGHLSLDDRSSQQSSSSVDVFVEELDYHVLDVGDVDLIDYSIDGLSKQLPHQLLMGLT